MERPEEPFDVNEYLPWKETQNLDMREAVLDVASDTRKLPPEPTKWPNSLSLAMMTA